MAYKAYFKQKYHKKYDTSPVYKKKKDAEEYLRAAMKRQGADGKYYTPSYMQGHVKKVKK